MIPRTLFSEDHELFRASVRRFIAEELAPHHLEWERGGIVPREVWRKAGDAGLLCCNVAEAYGGPGCDFLFNIVVVEELAQAGITAPGFAIHSDMVATYIEAFGSDAQRAKWLPGMVRGELIGALALTETEAGSDLRGLRARAQSTPGGYLINGQKTYISNGQNCDVAVVAAKTDEGLTLFLVDATTKGFVRGRRLEKLGLKGQDTSELFFNDLQVRTDDILGASGNAMTLLTRKLAQERLIQAIRSAAVVETTLEQTIAWVVDRKIFGQPLADFQNTRFTIAQLKSEAVAARVFVDRCIELHLQQKLTPDEAAMAKMLLSQLHCKAVDECLQFFGGAGYMWETPIARAYADARIVKIAGGSIEVMKHIISKALFGSSRKSPRQTEK